MKTLQVPRSTDFVAAVLGALVGGILFVSVEGILLEVLWSPLFRLALALLLFCAGVLTLQRRRALRGNSPWLAREGDDPDEDDDEDDDEERGSLMLQAKGTARTSWAGMLARRVKVITNLRRYSSLSLLVLAAVNIVGGACAFSTDFLFRRTSETSRLRFFGLGVFALSVLGTSLALLLLCAATDARLLLRLPFFSLSTQQTKSWYSKRMNSTQTGTAALGFASVGAIAGVSLAMANQGEGGEAFRLALLQRRFQSLPMAVLIGALTAGGIERARR